jgi:hypothetical protein
VSTLFLLTTSVTEIGLARLEAWLRRRTLIVDEGFVHRALGVWIRSPPAVREEVLEAYLDTIPDGSVCILLRCDPDTSLARAMSRERGIPLPTRRAAKAADPAASRDARISAVYREQLRLFDREPLRARVDIQEVDAMGTPGEIASKIEEALRRLGVKRPLLVFVRE